jgi:hypothetical protein
VGEEEYGENAEEYGNASFNEEDEWPSFVVASVNFGEARGEKSTKCTRPVELAQLCKPLTSSWSLRLTMGLRNRKDQF